MITKASGLIFSPLLYFSKYKILFIYRLHQHHNFPLHENNKYKCEECQAVFCYPLGLSKHISSVHEGRNTFQNHKCKLCKQSFVQLPKLQKHICLSHVTKVVLLQILVE